MTTDEITAETDVEITADAVPSAINDAKAEVERLYAVESKLCQEYQDRIGRIREYTPLAGDAILAGALAENGDLNIEAMRTTALIDQLSTLNADIAAIEQAITAARQRRVEAIKRYYAAQAADMRGQASTLRLEAAEIEAEIKPLLVKLQSITGVPYGPITRPAGDRLLFGDNPDAQQAGPMLVHTNFPKPALLHDGANALERSAADVERRNVPASGEVTSGDWRYVYDDARPLVEGATTARAGHYEQTAVPSVDGLLAELGKLGPLVLAPSYIAVHDWATRLLEAADRRVPRRPMPYRIVMVWHGGTINERESGVRWAGEH